MRTTFFFKIDANNCVFDANKLSFLEYEIDETGLSTFPENFPQPESLR